MKALYHRQLSPLSRVLASRQVKLPSSSLAVTSRQILSNYGMVSPYAEGSSIGFLMGAEYRKDGLNATPDQISQRADGGFTGVGGPTLLCQVN